MTNPATTTSSPSESVAVAQRGPTLEEVLMRSANEENLLHAYQLAREVEQTKLARVAATEMARLSWGKKLSDQTRAAIARYALQQDIDPVRHLDVLGGNLYPNAQYFYDRVAHEDILERSDVIVLAPLSKTDYSDMPITPKAQKELSAKAKEMNAQALMLAMEYKVPDAVFDAGEEAGAALVRLYWKDGTMTEGVNWAGVYQIKRKAVTGQPGLRDDPIGAENPVKSSITRAFRKAAKQKVSVHKFLRGEGTPLSKVERYIEADREERKNPPKVRPFGQRPVPVLTYDQKGYDVPPLPAGNPIDVREVDHAQPDTTPDAEEQSVQQTPAEENGAVQEALEERGNGEQDHQQDLLGDDEGSIRREDQKLVDD